MFNFQTSGYQSKSLVSDIAFGIFDGIDNGLWCYGFAAIVFAGALSGFMPMMLVILLVGWAFMGFLTAVTSTARVHLINLDEQAIVILSTIGGLMVAHMGGIEGNEVLRMQSLLLDQLVTIFRMVFRAGYSGCDCRVRPTLNVLHADKDLAVGTEA